MINSGNKHHKSFRKSYKEVKKDNPMMSRKKIHNKKEDNKEIWKTLEKEEIYKKMRKCIKVKRSKIIRR